MPIELLSNDAVARDWPGSTRHFIPGTFSSLVPHIPWSSPHHNGHKLFVGSGVQTGGKKLNYTFV